MSDGVTWLTVALIVLYLIVQAQVRRLERRVEALERDRGLGRPDGRD